MTQGLFDVVFTVVTVTLGLKPCVNIFLKFTVTCFRRLFIPYLVVLWLLTIKLFGRI